MPSSKPFGSLHDVEPREMAVQSPLQELTMAKNDSRFSPSHQIFCNVVWPTFALAALNECKRAAGDRRPCVRAYPGASVYAHLEAGGAFSWNLPMVVFETVDLQVEA